MENVSKALAAAPHAVHPIDGGLRFMKPLVREADVNLLFKKTPRFNLLLIGGGTRVSKVLETILPNLRDPTTVWFPGSQLVLPPIPQTGTLILREVGTWKSAISTVYTNGSSAFRAEHGEHRSSAQARRPCCRVSALAHSSTRSITA